MNHSSGGLSRRRLLGGTIAVAFLAVVLALWIPNRSPSTTERVAPGLRPYTSGTSIGDAPGDAPLLIGLGLRSADEAGLRELVESISDPSSDQYGQHLSLDDVRQRFGASDASIANAQAVLESVGIDSQVDATGTIVTARLTVEQAQQLFDTMFELRTQDDGSTIITPATDARVPSAFEGDVIEVAGLTEQYAPPSDGSSFASEACPAGAAPTDPASALDVYGITSLHEQGLRGEGMRMAIVEVEAFSQDALDQFESCYGLASSLEPTVTTLTPYPLLPNGNEVSMDVSVIATIAPALAGLHVIEVDPISDPALALAAAIDPTLTAGNQVDVVATSIGFCETQLDQVHAPLADHIVLAAAAAGITIVASTGDDGSSACMPATQAASVQYPASSPYVLAVGGSMAGPASSPGSTVVWNDTSNAGGGGSSARFPPPGYQRDAGITGDGRQVPDLAIGADPASWPPFAVCTPAGTCAWGQAGGTSRGAQVTGAAIALVDQVLRARGRPVLGWVGPLLYTQARSVSTTPIVSDISVGSNDLYSVGCCDATTGFDPASGWGTPRFDALLERLGQ